VEGRVRGTLVSSTEQVGRLQVDDDDQPHQDERDIALRVIRVEALRKPLNCRRVVGELV